MKLDVQPNLSALNINQISSLNAKSIIAGLRIGEVLRVQVMDISSEGLMTLGLPGGSLLRATAAKSDISLGDFLNLKVNSKSDSQVFVEVVKSGFMENQQQATETKNTLATDNDKMLAAKQQNLSDGGSILDAHTRNLLESLIAKHDSAAVSVIKDRLNALNIPSDKQSIEIFSEITKGNVAVTKEAFLQITSAMERFDGLTVQKAIFLLSNGIPLTESNINILNNLVEHKNLLGSKVADLMAQLQQAAGQASDGTVSANINRTDFRAFENQMLKEAALRDNIVKQLSDSQISVQPETPSAKEVVKTTGFWEADKFLSRLKEVLPQLEQLIHAVKNADDTRISQKLAVSKQTVHPNQISDSALDDEVELLSQTEAIKHVLTSKAAEDGTIRNGINKSLNSLSDNLNFLDKLNNVNVLHIPIRMNDYPATAELYVFKDGGSNKKGKIDPANTTVFLSLNTVNLGQLDTFIRITNKNVECQFGNKDNSVLQFIRNNITPLYGLLDAYGYKLVKTSYKQVDENINVMNLPKNIESERQGFSIMI